MTTYSVPTDGGQLGDGELPAMMTMAEYAEFYLNPEMARLEAEAQRDFDGHVMRLLAEHDNPPHWYDFARPLVRLLDNLAA